MTMARPQLQLKYPSKAAPDCPFVDGLRGQESRLTLTAEVRHRHGESVVVDEPSSAVALCVAATEYLAASPWPPAGRFSHYALRGQGSPLPNIHPVRRLDRTLQPGCGTAGVARGNVLDAAPYRSLLQFDRGGERHFEPPPRAEYPAK